VRVPSLVAVGVLAFPGICGLLMAQAALSGDAALKPQITFTLDFPGSEPAHYAIAVDAGGHGSYESAVKEGEGAAEQTYQTEFEMSAGNRDRIFEWAKQAQYFAGKIDSGKHNLAFTGSKMLSYQDGQRSFTARYNYSSQEAVRQLTAFFQNMAGTLEYGRRLTYYHRYQKLALDDELKHMEAQARNNELSEIQVVAPVLREIVEDASVIKVVRARAKELMEMGK